jgi:hypothetical protein
MKPYQKFKMLKILMMNLTHYSKDYLPSPLLSSLSMSIFLFSKCISFTDLGWYSEGAEEK